eukprot:gene27016-59611_t
MVRPRAVRAIRPAAAAFRPHAWRPSPVERAPVRLANISAILALAVGVAPSLAGASAAALAAAAGGAAGFVGSGGVLDRGVPPDKVVECGVCGLLDVPRDPSPAADSARGGLTPAGPSDQLSWMEGEWVYGQRRRSFEIDAIVFRHLQRDQGWETARRVAEVPQADAGVRGAAGCAPAAVSPARGGEAGGGSDSSELPSLGEPDGDDMTLSQPTPPTPKEDRSDFLSSSPGSSSPGLHRKQWVVGYKGFTTDDEPGRAITLPDERHGMVVRVNDGSATIRFDGLGSAEGNKVLDENQHRLRLVNDCGLFSAPSRVRGKCPTFDESAVKSEVRKLMSQHGVWVRGQLRRRVSAVVFNDVAEAAAAEVHDVYRAAVDRAVVDTLLSAEGGWTCPHFRCWQQCKTRAGVLSHLRSCRWMGIDKTGKEGRTVAWMTNEEKWSDYDVRMELKRWLHGELSPVDVRILDCSLVRPDERQIALPDWCPHRGRHSRESLDGGTTLFIQVPTEEEQQRACRRLHRTALGSQPEMWVFPVSLKQYLKMARREDYTVMGPFDPGLEQRVDAAGGSDNDASGSADDIFPRRRPEGAVQAGTALPGGFAVNDAVFDASDGAFGIADDSRRHDHVMVRQEDGTVYDIDVGNLCAARDGVCPAFEQKYVFRSFCKRYAVRACRIILHDQIALDAERRRTTDAASAAATAELWANSLQPPQARQTLRHTAATGKFRPDDQPD